jgi:hypothetical protein
LLSYLPPHAGGITPIANGLFHRLPSVREDTVTILSSMQRFNVSIIICRSRDFALRLADDSGREARRGLVELLSPQGVPPAIREERGADLAECTGMMRCTYLSTRCSCLSRRCTCLSRWTHLSMLDPRLCPVLCHSLGHTRTVRHERSVSSVHAPIHQPKTPHVLRPTPPPLRQQGSTRSRPRT